jgi:Arc/MetJ family transcription regulator
MRTNIEIEDGLLRAAMAASKSVTKKATVEAALQLAVQLKEQEEIRGLFGNVQWDGDLDEMRQSRVLEWEANRRAGDTTAKNQYREADEPQAALIGSTARS